MNLVAPFGFYGAGNIGDEATLQGFARLLTGYQRNIKVWVASRNPTHTARVEAGFNYFNVSGFDPRRMWARYRSDACVVPGGTPIMDVLGDWPLSELTPLVQRADNEAKSVVFVGTGTERLARQSSIQMMSEIIAPKVKHWTVRCEHDKERLTAYGVAPERVTVAADMAWLLNPVSTDFGRRYLETLGLGPEDRLLGVNINAESFMLEQEPRFFEKLGACLDNLISQFNVRVLFLCNEVREAASDDKAASLSVVTCMRNRDKAHVLPNEYWSPQQMMSLIGCCHVTVSTRYHFCLFSALQAVPFLAVKRSDKVVDLCWSMNWPFGVCLNEVGASFVYDMFDDIEKRKTHLAETLRLQSHVMRNKAIHNRAALDALFLKAGASTV